MKDYKGLAIAIKVLRVKQNMTQEELSAKSGLSLCAVNFIETCRKKPRETTVIKIANAFGVDKEELLKFII